MFKKLAVLYFFTFYGLATATPLKPYVFNNDYHHLSEYYQYLEDCSTFSPEEVLQKFNAGAFKSRKPNTAFNSGITTCSYWLAITVTNKTANKHKFLWSFYNNGLLFKMYKLSGNELIFNNASSMQSQMTNRPYPVRSVSFPFYLDAAETITLFVKVTPTTNKNVYFPTDVTTAEDYLQFEVGFSYLLGKYFGILSFALFLNFCMFLIVRERIYIYTILYVFSIILFQLSDFHFDVFEIPSSLFRIWSNINKDFFMGISLCIYAKIFQIFVDLKKHYHLYNKGFNYINLILFLCSMLLLVLSFFPSTPNYINRQTDLFLNVLIFIMILSILLLTINGLRERKKYFGQFAFAFLFLFYGFLSFMLNNINFYRLPIFEPGNIINGCAIESFLLTIFFVFRYRTEKEAAAQKIIGEQEKNFQLSKEMLLIETNEQERISRNIHDEIGSDITGLRLQLENHLMKSNIEPDQQQAILENVKLLYNKVRDISHFLKPETSSDNFLQTIDNQINFYRNNVQNITFEYFTNLDSIHIFEKNIQMQIIRIVREVYNNALKHALATKISMQIIHEDDALLITIEDNGIGFKTDNKTKGIGLENMRARIEFLQGKINIDSNDKGTSIILEIPIK